MVLLGLLALAGSLAMWAATRYLRELSVVRAENPVQALNDLVWFSFGLGGLGIAVLLAGALFCIAKGRRMLAVDETTLLAFAALRRRHRLRRTGALGVLFKNVNTEKTAIHRKGRVVVACGYFLLMLASVSLALGLATGLRFAGWG